MADFAICIKCKCKFRKGSVCPVCSNPPKPKKK